MRQRRKAVWSAEGLSPNRRTSCGRNCKLRWWSTDLALIVRLREAHTISFCSHLMFWATPTKDRPLCKKDRSVFFGLHLFGGTTTTILPRIPYQCLPRLLPICTILSVGGVWYLQFHQIQGTHDIETSASLVPSLTSWWWWWWRIHGPCRIVKE